jgi:hypothetical protein
MASLMVPGRVVAALGTRTAAPPASERAGVMA